MANPGDIPLTTILQHMQGMEQRLLATMDKRFGDVNDRLERLEKKVDQNYANLSAQIANIDERLDDLEVVQVPTIKKAVGIK